ncbi:MAG: hypothetical protein JWL84_3694 [Rhodospirillales bacterium]|jgi:hypothetical protein|nr:hypothetical protein [Rhodospirillales bacterium]
MKQPPSLLDWVAITVPGKGNVQGKVCGRWCVGGKDLCDVMLDDEKHTIVRNIPVGRIVCIIKRRVAA